MRGHVIALVSLSVLAGLAFADRFVADCSSEAGWDVLDLTGDGRVAPVDGVSCPPGYGPRALRMEGGELLAMPKGKSFEDGTIVVLYHENEPRDFDSDGVLLLRAQFGDDIAVFHNTKEKRPYTWVEQDNDTGFQLRQWNGNGVETTLAERAGFGLITDEWNVTGWIWQKVHVSGGHLQAKFWPADIQEPSAWTIEADTDLRGGRIGTAVHSGKVDIAYLAFDTSDDIRVEPPQAYLVFPQGRATSGDNLTLWLFTNREQPGDVSAHLNISVDGHVNDDTPVTLSLPAGHNKMAVHLGSQQSSDGTWFPLQKPLAAGRCAVSLSGGIETTCTFPIAPAALLEEQLADALRHVEAFGAAHDHFGSDAALCALHEVAQAHAKAAMDHYRAGRIEKAETALRYANEALAELNGYKGSRLQAAGVNIDALVPEPDAPCPEKLVTQDVTTVYSPDYRVRCGAPHLDAQSMVMGRAYHVTIPWTVEGASPDRDFAFRVTLSSPLGQRIVASSEIPPETPTHEWKAGTTYEQKVDLQVVPEVPDSSTHPAEPIVLDEYHHLLVSLTDPKSNGKLLLGNEPGAQLDRAGEAFSLGEVYVSSAPVELRDFEPLDGVVLSPRTEKASVRNVGTTPLRATVLLSVQSETKRLLYQAAQKVEFQSNTDCPLEFDWTADTAGALSMRLQVVAEGNTLTEACRSVIIAPPNGAAVRVEKENHVGEDLLAHVVIHADKGPIAASVHAGGALAGSAKSDTDRLDIAARPWFGYYDVEADLGTFRYDKRVVATVVETHDADLFVNGEPFLIKGTNVHGMDPASPARTATMMRIMRDLGFNTWRGDFPARWQVDLAYELNTVYTVLAPFSCTSTRKIFERQDGPPMATAREQTRVFIERYRDSAGVLLWNSCNEIDGDSIDFLISQYPLYKALDEYKRPVHYANLYGQDYSQGQDIMGVNCYFSGTQTAESRHPIVQRSLEIARNAKLPLIFCEFNAFNGAVPSQGADAMLNLYAWGIGQGMAGGFQYMKGDSTSHPGIFDSGYNTHALYDNAIVKAFADAEMSLLGVVNDSAALRVKNRRRFTLREVMWNGTVSGQVTPAVSLQDIPPGEQRDFELALPRVHGGPAFDIAGGLEFVTHFGFRCRVPVRLIAP